MSPHAKTTTTKQPHSPVPWTYRWNPEETGEGLVAACGQDGEGVYCEEKLFLWERPQEELEANARLIVRAVNNHEALLGALGAVLPYAHGHGNVPGKIYMAALAAIAAAKAQP